ncbi:MAG: hypothetical protein ACK559_32300, partial [bacterium]
MREICFGGGEVGGITVVMMFSRNLSQTAPPCVTLPRLPLPPPPPIDCAKIPALSAPAVTMTPPESVASTQLCTMTSAPSPPAPP